MNKYSYVSISMQMATATTKKLLIGNLPDSTQTAAVENLFKVVGPVFSVNVVRNGFAFVEMTAADADKARQQLNGYRWNGKPMTIDEAHPRTRP
ncbi:MAG TPA: RNA-binding protein [Terriglobia bacterium]|nr:RNA-binding protein [Terriglobia bacterium]